MYFLGDLKVLATLVAEASKHMPEPNATSLEGPDLSEDTIAGTTPPMDSDTPESNNEEESDHGT